MKRRPEEATTTHPLVVEAAARLLLDWGASEVTIADSPGGPYTRPLLHSIYETCGMTAAARQSGARLNEDTGFTTLRREENRLVREFSIINPVAEADLVVSVCKLKTHSMTTLSGGVKNLFGCIPGLQKPELHLRFPEKADPANRVYPNGGVVIKLSANQKYTTTGLTAGLFKAVCQQAGVPVQIFANRADEPGGSTLGNLLSQAVSIPMVDIGMAQLAMHSAVETAGSKDPAYMAKACAAFFQAGFTPCADGVYQFT